MSAINAGLKGTAAIGGALGVMIGAFAAHGASSPETADWLRTGGIYLLFHSIAALLAVHIVQNRWGVAAALLFLGGCVIFTGTLAIMAFDGPRWLGAVTPIGGTALIVGWLILACGVIRGD